MKLIFRKSCLANKVANFESTYWFSKATLKTKMIPLSKQFSTLLEAAKGENEIVKKIFRDLPSTFESEDDRNKVVKDYGLKVDAAIKDPSTVGPAVVKLMTYISSLKTEPEFFDCKAPLSSTDLTFKQIAGLADTKKAFEVDFIYPFRYNGLFPSVPKAVLLYGPPGTGKTTMARAATAEIEGAAFFAPTPGELKGKYEGETEKNIHMVFECAGRFLKDSENLAKETGSEPEYRVAPIFIDEFDSIGGKRGEDPGMTRSVNALLQEMDGIKTRKNVSVIAATNYPDSLDDAILRRFSTKIFIDLPDAEAREFLIRKPLAIAYGDPGFSDKQKEAELRDEEGAFIEEASYIENIKKYGKFSAKKSSTWFGSGVTDDKYITDEYIGKLVERLGPTKVGADIIKEIKKDRKPVDDSRLDDPTHIFGYSPSDITKIMELAIKSASTRALLGKVVKEKIGEKSYLVVDSNENSKGQNVSEITGSQASQIITFDIRESDVEFAIKRMPSTVDNRKYVGLLRYSEQV